MSDELLKSMNNNIDDSSLAQRLLKNDVPDSLEKFKVLIIGNSITWHPVAEDIGWNQSNGMAATAPDKDYASILLKRISSLIKNKTVEMKLVNLADWERGYKDFDFSRLKLLFEYKPDIVIF